MTWTPFDYLGIRLQLAAALGRKRTIRRGSMYGTAGGAVGITVSTETLDINPCPVCGTRHNYLLEVERSTVVQYIDPGVKSHERAFTRLFVCAKTNNRFQAEVMLSEENGEKIKEVRVERHQYQYLYKSGDLFCMMNKQTYEQIELSESMFEGQAGYLKENLDVDVLMEGENPLIVELPNFVELIVTGTEPGVRGDTATGATKPATMETGLVVQVPLFINEGDTLRIDTRSGKYVTRG